MMSLVRMAILSPVAVLLLMSGCGGDPLNRQAVSGTVTFKGQPLEHGKIEFSPLDGQTTLMGAEIANGQYSIPAKQGLTPGKYKVMINAPQGANLNPTGPPGSDLGPPPTELIPERYNGKSELRAEVKKGEPNVFDFTLK
jgi:hypothetical protein